MQIKISYMDILKRLNVYLINAYMMYIYLQATRNEPPLH